MSFPVVGKRHNFAFVAILWYAYKAKRKHCSADHHTPNLSGMPGALDERGSPANGGVRMLPRITIAALLVSVLLQMGSVHASTARVILAEDFTAVW